MNFKTQYDIFLSFIYTCIHFVLKHFRGLEGHVPHDKALEIVSGGDRYWLALRFMQDNLDNTYSSYMKVMNPHKTFRGGHAYGPTRKQGEKMALLTRIANIFLDNLQGLEKRQHGHKDEEGDPEA
ncbi:hypothetical protein ACJX0J_030696, partial [Zea mays]